MAYEFVVRTVLIAIGAAVGILIGVWSTDEDLKICQEENAALAETKPTFMVEAEGICRVTEGGKQWLLVDITDELRGVDEIAAEQEITNGKISTP